MECQVYWIRNPEHSLLEKEGYVGVSKDALKRFETHKKRNRVPKDSRMEIIFEGSRAECFALEKKLRPRKGIGWNNAPGGVHGWRVGFSHEDSTKEKMRGSWTEERRLNASLAAKERNPKLKGQKRPKQANSMKGVRNPNFGKPRSQEVRDAVSRAQTGKLAPNRQENYCVGCHKRVSLSRLTRYHTKCFQKFTLKM